MSLACEAEIKVQNEFALRFSIVSKPVPVLEYIRTISSLVGASHILAIFEEHESIKVFFDERRHVDDLIKSGIHVMGHHVRTDYVVPPGVKVILYNVDPIITNTDVSKLLSFYGSIVSPIIRPPISDDPELCHIGYGVRYVYMVLNADTIPNKIEFKYGELTYSVRVRIEDEPGLLSLQYIKTDDLDDEIWNPLPIPGPSRLATTAEAADPIVIGVESNGSEKHVETSISTKRTRGRPRKAIKLKPVSASSRAAGRITKNVKHKFMVAFGNARKIKQKKKRLAKRKYTRKLTVTAKKHASKQCLLSDDSTVNVSSNNVDQTVKEDEIEGNIFISDISGKKILHIEDLLLFLDEVKRHRAPIELARKYIGENCDDNMIQLLISQLHDYNKSHTDLNLRNRVLRLIKTLAESM